MSKLIKHILSKFKQQGEWICVGHDDTTYWYCCSICGHEEHDNMTKHDRYCCNCGHSMQKEPGVDFKCQ